jgi:hypothetical protein
VHDTKTCLVYLCARESPSVIVLRWAGRWGGD